MLSSFVSEFKHDTVQAMAEVAEWESANAAPAPDATEKWAEKLQQAILAGTVSITACLVLGMPLMPQGPLRPVTLPCCGFVVSHTGAQRLLAQRKCSFCLKSMAGDARIEVNDAVCATVAAEGQGVAPCVFQHSDVAIGEPIGQGGEATVVRGVFKRRDIAVKRVPLADTPGAAEMAGLRQVINASYIAGVASPHVCKLHGYCWAGSEVWCVTSGC